MGACAPIVAAECVLALVVAPAVIEIAPAKQSCLSRR
jgi:hypothetical protein